MRTRLIKRPTDEFTSAPVRRPSKITGRNVHNIAIDGPKSKQMPYLSLIRKGFLIRRLCEGKFPRPSWERDSVRGFIEFCSPSPHSSPIEGEYVRNFSSVKKVFARLIVALSVALGLASISYTANLERVRVGYSVGGLIPFPVVVARENNLFEQLGLEIELINIPPTLAVTALVSGDLQYVIFAGTTLNAAVRGLPVKLVMVYNDRPLFSLMSRPEIRSVKELKGKVLGIASLTSGESFLSRRLLKEAGVDPEREVTLRSIGNTPDRLAALRAGLVDATTLTVPVDIQAEKLGLRRLVFMGEILESINGGLGVSERWIQQRPDQIKKMITGVFRGMAYARTHRPESIALVMSKWKMERDVAEKAFDLMLRT